MAKKDDEDALTAAQKRAMRTGRSFFPAANIIQGSGAGNAGYGIGRGALPPEENPAYRAAIAKERPSRSGYEMIQTPSGGSMSVPIGQARKYTDLLYKGNATADTGFQRPDTQTAYNLGFQGGPATGNTPYARSYNLGYQGGPVNPAPSSGLGYQAGQAIAGLPNALAGFGRKVASWFGGGNLPSIPTTANAAQPTPTPYSTPSPSPTPTPFKTSDARSDLLRDTEGTFYGGGQVPIPTPTPTPVQRLAQPRRYFDYGYA